MINLKTIIKASPITEDTKKELLENTDSLSVDRKFELEEILWEAISNEYQNKLRYQMENAAMEEIEGKRHYSKEDFTKMEMDLFNELTIKLETLGSEEKLSEVRKQIQKQPTTQNSTPPTNTQDAKLSEATTAMQKIIAEIRASKKPQTNV